MRIINDVKLDFDSVLIQPKRSTLKSRKEVDLTRQFKFKHSLHHWEGIPVLAANMDGVGTFQMASVFEQNNMWVALHKHYTVEEIVGYYQRQLNTPYGNVWYSMGVLERDLEKFEAVAKHVYIPKVCIDVANGYSEGFVEFVAKFRDKYKNVTIMAGNVVTGDITEELVLNGVDIVKVGIGPGSTCITRKQTGVGYPQLSAVIECADAAHGLGGLICSDGGCRVPGDVSKAFAGGADFVMLGGMLAGHIEGGGTVIGDKVEFYGMSSATAQEKHNGGLASYKASEGKRVLIPYKGPVQGTIQEILGGVRSTCTYVGARHLKELTKRTTFVLVNQQRNTVFDRYDATN